MWRVSYDLLSGRAAVDIGSRSSWRLHDGAIIERESRSTFEVDPADPARASGRGRHTYQIARPGHVTRACTELAVESTASHFHVTIDLEVRLNGALHATQHWVESVPRRDL